MEKRPMCGNCNTNDLNDSLDDFLGGELSDVPVTHQPNFPVISPSPVYIEKCYSCRGTGRFYSYTGRLVGTCFKCKGTGTKSFKTSPVARQKATQARVDHKAETAAVFAATYPEVLEWLSKANPANDFANSLKSRLRSKGELTDGQVNAVRNSIQKAAEKAVARQNNAKACDMKPLNDAFTTARANYKEPKLRIGKFVVSVPKANSANANGLYVKKNGIYMGKVLGDKFFTSRDCDAATEAEFLSVAQDPKGAAIAYGIDTTQCACCGLTLSNAESIQRGIGPICASKWGW